MAKNSGGHTYCMYLFCLCAPSIIPLDSLTEDKFKDKIIKNFKVSMKLALLITEKLWRYEAVQVVMEGC